MPLVYYHYILVTELLIEIIILKRKYLACLEKPRRLFNNTYWHPDGISRIFPVKFSNRLDEKIINQSQNNNDFQPVSQVASVFPNPGAVNDMRLCYFVQLKKNINPLFCMEI